MAIRYDTVFWANWDPLLGPLSGPIGGLRVSWVNMYLPSGNLRVE